MASWYLLRNNFAEEMVTAFEMQSRQSSRRPFHTGHFSVAIFVAISLAIDTLQEMPDTYETPGL